MSKKSNRLPPVGDTLDAAFVSRCIDLALGAKRWDDFEKLTAYFMRKTKGLVGKATAQTLLKEALEKRINDRREAMPKALQ